MRTYCFYLYGTDGALIAPATEQLDCDHAARDRSIEILETYPGCQEVEIWEHHRYIGQGRRPYVPLSDDDDAPPHQSHFAAKPQASAQRNH
jgi:hypothetical protein